MGLSTYTPDMYNPSIHLFFVGIAGSGMSGLAEILDELGVKVSGSDLSSGASCRRLIDRGIQVFKGHSAQNLAEDVSSVVFSSAISEENPEIQEARRREIPVIRRAELLAELVRMKYGIAVAGSHGKTTTTSMTAAVLEHAALDPTVIIGGVVRSLGGGSKVGEGDFLVCEADESDRSFLVLKPTISVITNIDNEHMGAYDSFEGLKQAFIEFGESVPFYGLNVLCADDEVVREVGQQISRRKVYYGFSEDADIRGLDYVSKPAGASFAVTDGVEQVVCELPLPGIHMAQNALATFALARELDIAWPHVCKALSEFAGVKRRLEVVVSQNDITIIDDYAHHPTEIKATLKAVREGWGQAHSRVRVVFQPHRYSRTRDCLTDFRDAFEDADELIVTDVYAASEEPIAGIDGKVVSDIAVGVSSLYIGALQEVQKYLLNTFQPGELIICMGAGSITTLAHDLSEVLFSKSKNVSAQSR